MWKNPTGLFTVDIQQACVLQVKTMVEIESIVNQTILSLLFFELHAEISPHMAFTLLIEILIQNQTLTSCTLIQARVVHSEFNRGCLLN